MALFDRAEHIRLYTRLLYSKYAACFYIYYRFRDIAAYWSKIVTPACIRRPRWGWCHQIYAIILGVEKLEWWAYRTVKEFRWYAQPFWHKARVWQTGGRTDGISVAYTRYSIMLSLWSYGTYGAIQIYTVSQKNMSPYFRPYLRQILTNSKNSFTGTLYGKFAIKRSLIIPPHLNCVATLPCETLM